jgi:hypothetical protein
MFHVPGFESGWLSGSPMVEVHALRKRSTTLNRPGDFADRGIFTMPRICGWGGTVKLFSYANPHMTSLVHLELVSRPGKKGGCDDHPPRAPSSWFPSGTSDGSR